MALIKCPECGNSISDMAEKCIFCGFPLSEQNAISYTILLSKYGYLASLANVLSDHFGISFNTYLAQKSTLPIPLLSGVTKENADFFVLKYQKFTKCEFILQESHDEINQSINSVIQEMREKANAPITCPRCGSTQITTGARGVSWTRGLIGASQTVNRCAKCGYTWKP